MATLTLSIRCTGGSGESSNPDAGPAKPYALECDTFDCPDGIVIGDSSCLWECLEYGGETVRFEVLFTEGQDGCLEATESIREPVCTR